MALGVLLLKELYSINTFFWQHMCDFGDSFNNPPCGTYGRRCYMDDVSDVLMDHD